MHDVSFLIVSSSWSLLDHNIFLDGVRAVTVGAARRRLSILMSCIHIQLLEWEVREEFNLKVGISSALRASSTSS